MTDDEKTRAEYFADLRNREGDLGPGVLICACVLIVISLPVWVGLAFAIAEFVL